MNTKFVKVPTDFDLSLSRVSFNDMTETMNLIDETEDLIDILYKRSKNKTTSEKETLLDNLCERLTPKAQNLVCNINRNSYRELRRLIIEDKKEITQLKVKIKRRGLSLKELKQASWKIVGNRKEREVSVGDQICSREPIDLRNDPRPHILYIVRLICQENLPREFCLFDLETEVIPVIGRPKSISNFSYRCSAGFLSDDPQLLRFEFFLLNKQVSNSSLFIGVYLEAPDGVDTKVLLKDCIKRSTGICTMLGTALCLQLCNIPWRPLPEILEEIENYKTGPTFLLAELGMFNRDSFANVSVSSRILESLPNLILQSDWESIHQYAVPISVSLTTNRTILKNVELAIIEKLNDNKLTEFITDDRFLLDVIQQLRADSQAKNFEIPKSLLTFFDSQYWNSNLSAAFRESLEQLVGLRPFQDQQVKNIRDATFYVLRRAFDDGDMLSIVKRLPFIFRVLNDFPDTLKIIRDEAWKLISDLPKISAKKNWANCLEMETFIKICEVHCNEEDLQEHSNEVSTLCLPDSVNTSSKYLCHSVQISILKAWLRYSPSGQYFDAYMYDFIPWIIRCRMDAVVQKNDQWKGPRSLFDCIPQLYQSHLDDISISRHAMQEILIHIEAENGINNSTAIALAWIRGRSIASLTYTLLRIGNLKPWKVDSLEFKWRNWLLKVWGAHELPNWTDDVFLLSLDGVMTFDMRQQKWQAILEEFFNLDLKASTVATFEKRMSYLASEKQQMKKVNEVLGGLCKKAGTSKLLTEFQSLIGTMFAYPIESNDQICLLLGALPFSNSNIDSNVINFLTRHTTIIDIYMKDRRRLFSLIVTLREFNCPTSGIAHTFTSRMINTELEYPEMWTCIVNLYDTFGSQIKNVLPLFCQHIAPSLIFDWVVSSNLEGIAKFSEICGDKIKLFTSTLIPQVADQILSYTKTDVNQLRGLIHSLLDSMELLEICPCELRIRVEKILSDPPIPFYVMIKLLRVIICLPVDSGHELMRDMAWQIANDFDDRDKNIKSKLIDMAL